MSTKPRIFLSAATDEHATTRMTLRDTLTRGGCDVEFQPDFPQTDVDTVEKLDQILHPCDVVVHIVGHQPGSVADGQAVVSFLNGFGDEQSFLGNWPDLREELGDFSGLTYTQWEAFMALHRDIPLFVYAPSDRKGEIEDRKEFCQQEHLDRLWIARRYAEDFADNDDLLRKVMADLMNHFRSHLSAEQLPPIFKPNNLPLTRLGSLFKGRDEFLNAMRQRLLGNEGRAAAITSNPCALHGTGGVGKTRAAIEYAWQNEQDYTALLFVTADSAASLDANLAELSGVLAIQGLDAAEESMRLAAVVNWLQSHPGWLAILDNVDTDEAAKAVRDKLTQLRHGHVIITTRISKWIASVQRLDLNVLDLLSARDYLLEATEDDRRPIDTDFADAGQVAQNVGQLALGLEHAAAYIRTHGFTLAEYVDLWQKNADSILEEFDLQQIDYPREILVTWKLSADRLSDDSRTLLNVLCCFAPDLIPESLLDSPPEPFPINRPRHALAELVRYCLARRQLETKTFSVHRLVQATTRYHLRRQSDGTEALNATLLAALNWLDATYVGKPLEVCDRVVLEPLQSHVDTVCQHAFRQRLVSAEYPTSRLIHDSSLLHLSKSKFAAAERLAQRALAIDEQSYGAEHPNVARDLRAFGRVVGTTHRYADAEAMFRRALAIDEQYYGADHPNVAENCQHLGMLLMARTRFEDAEQLVLRALKIRERFHGPEHPRVAGVLNDLALLLVARHRYPEAEELSRRALAIYEQSGKAAPPSFALRNLAMVLNATNRRPEAEKLLRRALDIDERSYGSDHPHVAEHLLNLGAILHNTKRSSEAEPLARRALDIYERTFGRDHPKCAANRKALATVLIAMNRVKEADQVTRRVLRENSDSRVELAGDGDERQECWNCRQLSTSGILCSNCGAMLIPW